MIISVKAIRNPQVLRTCEMCQKPIKGVTLKMYGAAFTGDRPYTIFIHKECAHLAGTGTGPTKARKALADMEARRALLSKEDRCYCCGAFLSEVDRSTENGFDFDLICKNPKCRAPIC